MDKAAGAIVFLAGTWMISLGVWSVLIPDAARKFLNKFASSAKTHFIEVLFRIAVGAAFVVYASAMRFATVFTVFGWMLILTSIVLLFVPWRLHRRSAERSLPLATRRMSLFGFASLAGGIGILAAYLFGPSR